MRRMLLPEAKIKSKKFDDKELIILNIEKYFTNKQNGKVAVIQPISFDVFDGDTYTTLDIGGSTIISPKNQILTLGISDSNVFTIKGIHLDSGNNIVFESNIMDFEDESIAIGSAGQFDLYIYKD